MNYLLSRVLELARVCWCGVSENRSESGLAGWVGSWSQQQVKLPHDLNFPSGSREREERKAEIMLAASTADNGARCISADE
ncbi:unnamed protein product [Linum trigynum]|uniref:Uncharacterized protein n=1 Tax=Linum trigynum TaxID=586398 RepID=A0AAV2FFT6_9ROSI